jgi:DNA-binding IclR family transcriptional regulator
MDMFAHTVKLLMHGPRTVPDLAEMVGCHEQSARRYVQALNAHGLVAADGRLEKYHGRYSGKPAVLWKWQ